MHIINNIFLIVSIGSLIAVILSRAILSAIKVRRGVALSEIYTKKRRNFLFIAPIFYGLVAFLCNLVFPNHKEFSYLIFLILFLAGFFLAWRVR